MVIKWCVFNTPSFPFIRSECNTLFANHLIPRGIDDQTQAWRRCREIGQNIDRGNDVLICNVIQEFYVEVIELVVVELEWLVVELDGMADTKALKMAKGPRLYDNKIKMFVNI